ncbi:hypothetical protein PHISP_04671 [Aspergillus sp. HF37]|nr:hypothetical protein PHISP_04671 [Aspergillus sp. HF37]
MQPTAERGPSVLDHLPPSTNTYVYESLDQFASILSAETERLQQDRDNRSQLLVFAHVPNYAFEQDLQEPASDIPRYTLDAYTAHDNLLIVKMRSGPHEAAHEAVRTVLIGKLSHMSHAERGLYGLGQTTVKGNQRAKEADISYIPVRLPRGRSDEWPTLALESGYTDSQGKLTANAEWWLSASNGDTKIAMTLDIDKKSRKITIKAFEYSDTGNLHEESVTVQKPYNSDIQVLGAPLRIPFRKLFLREPVGNEEDIMWEDDDLTYIAEAAWSRQKF